MFNVLIGLVYMFLNWTLIIEPITILNHPPIRDIIIAPNCLPIDAVPCQYGKNQLYIKITTTCNHIF